MRGLLWEIGVLAFPARFARRFRSGPRTAARLSFRACSARLDRNSSTVLTERAGRAVLTCSTRRGAHIFIVHAHRAVRACVARRGPRICVEGSGRTIKALATVKCSCFLAVSPVCAVNARCVGRTRGMCVEPTSTAHCAVHTSTVLISVATFATGDATRRRRACVGVPARLAFEAGILTRLTCV